MWRLLRTGHLGSRWNYAESLQMLFLPTPTTLYQQLSKSKTDIDNLQVLVIVLVQHTKDSGSLVLLALCFSKRSAM